MTFNTREEVKREILLTSATSTNADNLRYLVFSGGQLLEQYLQISPIDIDDLREIINQVDQRLQDLRFDEFKDEEFANWKRVRACVEHENTLVNHRLSWLFSSQAFLFTAFTLIFNEWKSNQGGLPIEDVQTGNHFLIFLIVIAAVGILICQSIQRGLNSAEDQLRALDKWWHRDWNHESDEYTLWTNRKTRDEFVKKRSLKHPPLQGFIRYEWWDRWLTYSIVPTLFSVAWAVIVILIVFDLSSPVGDFLGKEGFTLFSYIIVVIVSLSVKEWYDRMQRKP